MKDAELIQPEKPKSIELLTNSDILLGTPVPAIDKLKIVSSDEFEDIIREWIVGYCQVKYIKVWKAGGANDKGRDVVAFFNEAGEYDNFQCKHYDHPLAPTDIWKELGKLCYYTFNDSYKSPRKYYFVSPRGVGPKLSDLFQKPNELKAELIKEWNDKCKKGITDKVEVSLTEKLLFHINTIDFSIFTYLDPQELIEQHKQTSYYAARFGGGLQKRIKPRIKSFQKEEYSLRFVEQLFEAYSDHFQSSIKTLNDLKTYSEQFDHFNRHRICFYWAEALNEFSRDHLPPENTCFEDLKEEVYIGVIDTCNLKHESGYENVNKTTNESTKLNLKGNALIEKTQIQDKIGICHHLANENKLIWVKK